MRDKKQAFTLMELMIVVGIIAILLGVLLPALNVVQKMARNTKQKAQLTTIALAITTFKNDHGDYPPSDWYNLSNGNKDYSGAQMLTEALLGWDLMGLHPDSAWRADGKDASDNDLYEKATDNSYSDDEQEKNLKERTGPYIEQTSIRAFYVGKTDEHDGLYVDTVGLYQDSYVLCDIFPFKRIISSPGQSVMAGTPILYYRAHTNSKTIESTISPQERIYSALDNATLIEAKKRVDGKGHSLGDTTGTFKFFYEYIKDIAITTKNWPYRPDSYILISAGADGEYGTPDDITNFK